MNGNTERLVNRIKEYITIMKLSSNSFNEYKKIAETDDAIHLYMTRRVWNINVAMMMYAMIELGIDKRLNIYEEQDKSGYYLRYADFRDSLLMPVEFFRALYFANIIGSPILFRNLLELRGEKYLEQLKVLLYKDGGLYINDIECRRELIEFIKSHTIEEEILL